MLKYLLILQYFLVITQTPENNWLCSIIPRKFNLVAAEGLCLQPAGKSTAKYWIPMITIEFTKYIFFAYILNSKTKTN